MANRAGVSQPTASRVLNGSDRKVGGVYRDRVLQAARALGYRPDIAAQTFARGTSPTVSLVVGDISGAFFASMAAELMRAARSSGLHVAVTLSGRDAARELAIVDELRTQRPRAIIFAGTALVDEGDNSRLVNALRRYESGGGRVLLIGRHGLPFASVDFDDRGAASQMGAELAARGYRSAFIVGRRSPLVAMRERVQGFQSGFGGTVIDHDEAASLTWEDGRAVVLEADPAALDQADVLFAVTDELALGAIAGLRERGLAVPTDMAVAGFNDGKTARDSFPPLTSAHVPLETVAAETIRLLHVSTDELRSVTVPTYPVMRASSPRLTPDGRTRQAASVGGTAAARPDWSTS